MFLTNNLLRFTHYMENLKLRYTHREPVKKFWKKRNVEPTVWKKLNWGIADDGVSLPQERYPCRSLWESVTINSDGKVSACCIDWKQALITGDLNKESILDLWNGEELKDLREVHREGREETLPLCSQCNYWSWLPRMKEYY